MVQLLRGDAREAAAVRDEDLRARAVAGPSGDGLDGGHDVHARRHGAEHDVPAVQVGRRGGADEN